MSFVQIKGFQCTEWATMHNDLCELLMTQQWKPLVEPYGQRQSGIYSALSAAYIESLCCAASALSKYPIDCCKNTPQRSSRPNIFKQRLITLHNSTREHIRQAKEQIMSPPDLSDQSDRATWEEQCTLLMRIVDREQKLLPKIQQALERIRLGEYGYCLESGEPIGIARLLARPTAEYCADVKVFSEHKEHLFKKQREF